VSQDAERHPQPEALGKRQNLSAICPVPASSSVTERQAGGTQAADFIDNRCRSITLPDARYGHPHRLSKSTTVRMVSHERLDHSVALYEARSFVQEHRRHHDIPQGGLRAIAPFHGDDLIGVEIGST
jgi:hypothetical protein